jgi:cadmium resistance protein CadD (predicted permease)
MKLIDLLTVVALTGVTFVGTSFDNLLLLIGFLGHGDVQRRNVVLGYAGAVLLMVAAVFSLSSAAHFAPQRYIGYLGLIPIGLGLLHLWGLVRGREAEPRRAATPQATTGALSVGLVMLANSGDTFAALVTLFADTQSALILPMTATLLAMVFAWGAVAEWLVSHPSLAGAVRIIARYALPFLLIAIGLYILSDSGTDVLVQ